MRFFSRIDSLTEHCCWYGIALLTVGVAGFILMFAKLWPSLEWYWYGVIALAAAGLFMCKSCRNRCNDGKKNHQHSHRPHAKKDVTPHKNKGA